MKNLIDRGAIFKKNIIRGSLFKVIGIALGYISIPVTLDFLGVKNFGVWISIFSVLSWIYTFDLGIGNGLKIKLSEALATGDKGLAKKYISTSYALISGISLLFLLIGVSGTFLFDFSSGLNISFLSNDYLQKIIVLCLVFTLINFVLGLYKQIFCALQKSFMNDFVNVIFQAVVILLLISSPKGSGTLFSISTIFGSATLIISVGFTFYIFKKYKSIRPDFKSIDLGKVKDIGGLGMMFFIIQVSMIIILTTDNLIITKLFGPEHVTIYNMPLKIFQGVIVFWAVISTPITPLFTDAYIKKDYLWINSAILKLNKIFILVIIVVFFIVLFGDEILYLWLRKDFDYPKYMFLFFGVFVILRVYGDLYMSFLNAIGKIKIQLYLYLFGALINIPLSIYFGKNLDLGSSGVILATCVSLFLLAIIMPIQAYIELKKMKTGF
ncbi:lipopolysaccharide biosynthesis protein [Vibrio atlanticus]|uniref:lipopolysaccharide biosynthesis protein n=1 Tax=Vibrio atlanticus TaxID=693153 RepID=UPI0009FF293B|nr:oligosaccharide flippase family protein [Vibrio atlanticus]